MFRLPAGFSVPLSILRRQFEHAAPRVVSDGRSLLRHLDLKHLRQLMEVADKGSIRAAAEALAITQPALSRSIRAMEEELGVKLVERGPRGAELTAVGTRLLKYSRIIDANLALAEKELRGYRDSHSRIEQITFGMSWLTEALIAGPLIERVLRNRPGVRLATSVGDYESLAPKLMSGRLDFFIGPPRASAHEARRDHDRRSRRRAVDLAGRGNRAPHHLRQLFPTPRRRGAGSDVRGSAAVSGDPQADFGV
jgi:DNA-binding transcriptional LysR family regulator